MEIQALSFQVYNELNMACSKVLPRLKRLELEGATKGRITSHIEDMSKFVEESFELSNLEELQIKVESEADSSKVTDLNFHYLNSLKKLHLESNASDPYSI